MRELRSLPMNLPPNLPLDRPLNLPPKRRFTTRWIGRLVLGLAALLLLLALLAWAAVRASLPQLDGAITLTGLKAPLNISRDALGSAVLQGNNSLDLARGLGFVHAQERFFEMDLTRRSAAGELSALFGEVALERDQTRRTHRLRARLTERLAQLPADEQALLQAYSSGVNSGLAALHLRPWQYLLLRAEPQGWQPVDSLLVIGEMFWMLQGSSMDAGFERSQLRERTGDVLFDWLNPRGGRWDAALDGNTMAALQLPSPAQLDLRRANGSQPSSPPLSSASAEEVVIGSNNWAVAGSRTGHGGAMLANDMHLGLAVPSIWYRAQLELTGASNNAQPLRAAGLTLPGLPALVVGSNGAVAWGFTNAYGQWFDWIKLPASIAPERLRRFQENIAVKGGAARPLEVLEFDGAPVVREVQGQPGPAGQPNERYALRWIAHQGEAFNLKLAQMLQAQTADAAALIAQASGMPHQNILIADSAGNIVWTVAGRLWSQPGIAQSYARFQSAVAEPLPAHTWLTPADYPLLKNPSDGQLWTANNRQLGGAAAEAIGDGGFDLGARAQQIRDRLSQTARFDEASLGAIHLDNEARFLSTWSQRLLPLLERSPAHREAAQLVQQWNGRADADQVGYRLVRAARLKTLDLLWATWTQPFLATPAAGQLPDEKKRMKWRAQFEYSVSQALDQQPAHLLPPGFANWDALLLAQVDASVLDLTMNGKQPLAQATWGQHNRSQIQHVLSRAIPALAQWLDMPSMPQGGDANLPHVAQAAFGQSERLVVSPGREASATLSMPGGQSGHPLSPFYAAGHADWAQGRSTPLLAGPELHRLSAAPVE
jgi:penicillin amidase